ncbi:InlB B-repeat-containing protein, partial [Anaerosphaera multitolerans]
MNKGQIKKKLSLILAIIMILANFVPVFANENDNATLDTYLNGANNIIKTHSENEGVDHSNSRISKRDTDTPIGPKDFFGLEVYVEYDDPSYPGYPRRKLLDVKLTVTNKNTGDVIESEKLIPGTYTSDWLPHGTYTIEVENPDPTQYVLVEGFKEKFDFDLPLPATVSDLAVIYNYIPEGSEFSVTYDGNDNTSGEAPVDSNKYMPGNEVIVLDKGNLEKGTADFTGWNTSADGSGIAYVLGDTFNITEDTILYAQWKSPERIVK